MDRRLPEAARRLLRDCRRELRPPDARLYLVGGAVRDLLLGRPALDLDLAIVGGDPIALARRLARRLGGRCTVHPRFLTAVVVLPQGRLELAASREERYPHPASLPRVAPAPIDRDLLRRDFTVNSLAMEVRRTTLGPPIDPGGGLVDLERGLLRVHHPGSFDDDPTRAFRAARFAARFGWRIEAGTRRGLERAVRQGRVGLLGADRLRHELAHAFEERGWAGQATALARLGLDRAVDRGLSCAPPFPGALARLERLLRRLDAEGGAPDLSPWAIGLALLTAGRPPADRRRLVERLRPGRAERRLLLEGAGGLAAGLERSARLAAGLVDVRASRAATGSAEVAAVIGSPRVRRALRQHLFHGRRLRLAIDGDALLAAGVPQGPAVARGLAAARTALLERGARRADQQLGAALRALGLA